MFDTDEDFLSSIMSENFLVEDEISLSSSDSSQYEKFICKTESNEIGDENTSFDMFFSSELCLSENITYKKLKEKSNEQTRMENKMYGIKLQKKLEKQNTRLTNLTFEESKARSDKTASENLYLTPSSYNSITNETLENTHDRCEQLDLKYPALLHNSNKDIQNISKPTNSIATNNDILIHSQIENMENASSSKNGINNNNDIFVGKRRGEEACEEIKRIKTACACFWNGDEESGVSDHSLQAATPGQRWIDG